MEPADWDTLQYFSAREFKNPENMGFEFMQWLDKVRGVATVEAFRYGVQDIPFKITSSYRSPEYNRTLPGAAKQSAHMCIPCNAVDVMPKNNQHRFFIEWAALKMGCKRKGNYCSNGSLHLDRCEDHLPGPSSWLTSGEK